MRRKRTARAVWQTPPAMPEATSISGAIRGPALTFAGDAFTDDAALRFESDALIAFAEGRITHFGPAAQVRAQLPPDIPIKEYGRDHLIMPGFIDCHVHYPQLQIIGAHGEQLLDWLEKYTFVAEQEFSDPAHASEVAGVFLDECLRNGTTTVA